jgi:ribosomal protein L14
MLFKESILNVSDNSGVFTVKLISLYGKAYSSLGSFVLCCIKKTRSGKTFQNKYLAVIVSTKFPSYRKSGVFLRYDDNSVVLFKDKDAILASRVVGIIDANCSVAKKDKLFFLTKHFV